MQVDAHHHVWQVARGDYGWMSPELPIARDYGLSDLVPLLDGVSATILVQAAETEAETDFMLGVARTSGGLVRGVVGWVDLAAADAPARVAARAADPLVRGLRPILQDMDDVGWILRPEVQPGLAAMAAHGLRLDALIKPRHLAVIGEVARRHPGLSVVIDHGAKPDIAGGRFEPWAAQMARLAGETGWCCKLSGLATEAGPEWDAETLRPYVAHLLAVFGPERLMWGSDWPVVDLAGGYRRWRDAALALIPEGAREAVLGGTARRFYGI
jgi:L-fuconolactonase